jgi:hypothetical protein
VASATSGSASSEQPEQGLFVQQIESPRGKERVGLLGVDRPAAGTAEAVFTAASRAR